MSSLLVFINAHLACNYINRVAVIASHCDTARWLYPRSDDQHPPQPRPGKRRHEEDAGPLDGQLCESTKKLRPNGKQDAIKQPDLDGSSTEPASQTESNKYQPFRLVEEELIRNLTLLLNTTLPKSISSTTSTMIAGALTLALSYINRETLVYAESMSGPTTLPAQNFSSIPNPTETSGTGRLQSRILLLSCSSTTDLAHQYIPIMNSIFACQRLNIPIDICQISLPAAPSMASTSTVGNVAPTPPSAVFLQQASDATKGIYIPVSAPINPTSLLQYLLMAFLPSQSSRAHLVIPTRIDVDFRAACFCHRKIVDVGFVCSICLSIFCAAPENGECLTCGTQLQLGDYGARPVVVPRKKKRKTRGLLDGSRVGTPRPTTPG